MADIATLHARCRATVGPLLIDVDFTLTRRWTVLFGASGSGKSSLLRLIAGVWSPPYAAISLRGEDVSGKAAHLRKVGFVAQQPALFPHLDVLGNVLFGCTRQARPHGEAMLDLFDLQVLRHARTERLSGGERQRVALARALAASPRLLLLDEVFTGMHLPQRDDLLKRVQQHCTAHDIPVLSVTHDAVEAVLAADEVLRLESGHIVARGSASEVLAAERNALRKNLTDH